VILPIFQKRRENFGLIPGLKNFPDPPKNTKKNRENLTVIRVPVMYRYQRVRIWVLDHHATKEHGWISGLQKSFVDRKVFAKTPSLVKPGDRIWLIGSG
jgi:hypothetical protein